MAACLSCNQENRAGARFCDACAAPLGQGAEPSREVRKTVTVLFCDVVGSTELASRLDPEVLRGVMTRFYTAIREPVERHGGTVEKLIGDALVAVFGIPVVHEDDAVRALRAALEMRDAVRAIGEIEARIGVNTGEIFAGDAQLGEPLVVGDAVNVAARLQAAAEPGTVLVGDATWGLAEHAAHGERVAPVAAKGKAQPLVAWRLAAVDAHAGGHRRRLDLPLVARESELGLLRVAVDRTERLDRPHLVTLFGQPGIGKSRLVAELPHVGGELTVMTGNCRATASPSMLEPLLEAVRGAIPVESTVAEGIAALMPGDAEAAAVAACLAPGASAGSQDIAWALTRLFGAMARERLVAIVVEDVHWADDGLLDVVEQLAGRARQRSLLVVCTARPEFATRRPEWGTGTNALSISLERLDDAETRRLLGNASPALRADQVERVIATAEGNPLFAEHLAALVSDAGPAVGLPRSIQVLLSSRLEALPESEREVVSVAAVAGRDFPVAAVETLVARPISAEIERLTERELIEPTASGRAQFGHALLQEAAYGLIPMRRRSDLHARLARWLDEADAGDAAVGDHLEQAFRLRAELGFADDETARLSAEAGARLAAAGLRADSMGDPLGARQLLERALELLPERSPRRAQALVELAAAAWNLLPREETQKMVVTACELAAELGLRSLELRAWLLMVVERPGVPDENESGPGYTSQLAAAVQELEQLDDPRALAAGLTASAENACDLGYAGAAFAASRRALDILRAIGQDTVWALSALIWALRESPVPAPEAERLLAGLMDELGKRPTVRSELIQGQAVVAQLAGRDDDAWALLASAREIERDLGRLHSWRLDETEAMVFLLARAFEPARDRFARMVEVMEERHNYWEELLARSRLAFAEARLGDVVAARALATAVLAAAPAGGFEGQVRALLAMSDVAERECDAAGAVELARQAVSVTGDGDWVLLQADAQMQLSRALRSAGDHEAATASANVAARVARAKGHAAGLAEAEAFPHLPGAQA